MQRSWKKRFRPSGGDFQGIAGLSSDDSLLAENQRRLSGAAQNQASAIAHTGLEVKKSFSTSGRGRNVFLDIPLYRPGDNAQNISAFQNQVFLECAEPANSDTAESTSFGPGVWDLFWN